jgi:hypothetical protein
MRRQQTATAALACLALCLVCATSARATTIHSNVSGATVNFTDISEGSPSGDPEPLYGQPSAVGDTLVFPTTSNFAASSLDGGASDQTDGKLTLTMEAKAGYTLTSLNISEGGLTTLNAPFGGDAFTQVVGFAVVKVLEIDNLPVVLPAVQSFMSFSPLGGQYLLSSIGGSSYATGWTGTLTSLFPAGTTKALVTLNNNLFAASLGNGTRAFIDKKAFEIDIETELVPEPTTVALGLFAAGGVALTSLRRRFAI